MKVSINAGGRLVEIECPDANTTVDAVGDKALSMWQATAGAVSGGRGTEGPAFGLTAAERRQPDRSRWIGEGVPLPVRAQADDG